MSETIISTGVRVVFGVRPAKPILGAPAGKQRLRMRNHDAARLFVRNETGIREFVLEDGGDAWWATPRMEQGANMRPKKQ